MHESVAAIYGQVALDQAAIPDLDWEAVGRPAHIFDGHDAGAVLVNGETHHLPVFHQHCVGGFRDSQGGLDI